MGCSQILFIPGDILTRELTREGILPPLDQAHIADKMLEAQSEKRASFCGAANCSAAKFTNPASGVANISCVRLSTVIVFVAGRALPR